MSTETQKTELLEQFQKYLAQSQPGLLSTEGQPDLNTLLSEITGLKTEVKIETRQFKNTLDSLGCSLDSLKDDNKTLSTELAASHDRLEQQKSDITKTMLLQIIEIYDRVSTGVEVLQNYQPVNSLFNHSKKKDTQFIEQFKQGQQMTLKRFEQLLQGYQVKIIDCIGKRLDPLTMSAIETGHNPDLENGMILEELRKGFLYQNQVLRLAEVKVNKHIVG